jgi:hypothetical protein
LLRNQVEIDVGDCNCPLCGRPLWDRVDDPGESRYCGSCNERFYVKKALLQCPFCPSKVGDYDFNHHVTVGHPDKLPEKNVIRWLEGLRMEAGGVVRGGGEGRGLHNV